MVVRPNLCAAQAREKRLRVIRASARVSWSVITMRMCLSFDPRLRERDKERERSYARHDWFVVRQELFVPRP